MRYVKRILLTSTFVSLAWAGPASAQETSNPSDTPDAADTQVQAPVDHLAAARELVNQAQQTFENFVADPKMGGFRTHVGNARAIFLVPELGRGGLILGASGGRGVLLARDDSGAWSAPVFYSMGSANLGLQAGIQTSELVLLATTDRGRDAFLSTKVQLGADANVAFGPYGAGAQAATPDIISFARTKGLYGGLVVDGAVIKPDDSRNAAYYGTSVSPMDIVVHRKVGNPQAAGLIDTVSNQTGVNQSGG